MSRLPHDTTKLFCNVWEEAEDFAEDYKASGIYQSGINQISGPSIDLLFYLLYSRYGNSAIANFDENQFKYRVFATIFQYGPTWEKRLSVQTSLRNLTEAEIMSGSKTIHNHAYNPSTDPSTASLTELETINEQNTDNYKRGKIEGYANLIALLETDVTAEFLDRFKPLFAKFVYTKPDLFITEVEEEEEEE